MFLWLHKYLDVSDSTQLGKYMDLCMHAFKLNWIILCGQTLSVCSPDSLYIFISLICTNLADFGGKLVCVHEFILYIPLMVQCDSNYLSHRPKHARIKCVCMLKYVHVHRYNSEKPPPPHSVDIYIYPRYYRFVRVIKISLCNTASNGPAHTSMIFMRLWLAIHLLCCECSVRPPKKFPPDEVLDVLVDLPVLLVMLWSADHLEQLLCQSSGIVERAWE